MDAERIKNGLHKSRNFLLIGGPLLFLLICAFIYFFTGRYVSTDDAYIQAARTEINSKVSGQVVEILVRDNQEVHEGQVLFKIDDRDFVTAVEAAKAKVANAKLQVESMKANYLQGQAEKRAALAVLDYMQREYKRQQMLRAQGISSQTVLEQAREEFISAQQRLHSADQELNSLRATLADNPDIEVQNHPIVQAAQAELDQALLNLSYTIISAPKPGIVTKVELLQVGDYIKYGEPAFALVSKTDIWVEANYKETELTYIRPGQNVSFTVDTYPRYNFKGKVVSICPGTGESFSLLPPENATGNWVKVVQRVPVRISIDNHFPHQPLRMGMSVETEVDTLHNRLTRK